jgi:hypothetical protein
MAAWRTLASVVVALSVAASGQAQTYPLVEKPKAGDCCRFRLEMKLEGEQRVAREGQTASLPLKMTATHEFSERVLDLAATGLPQKSARVYETARVTIARTSDVSERSLRPERRLLVAQRAKEEQLVYAPSGPLTREELEVTEHLDTLSLTGLLPGKEVGVGETWKVGNAIAVALCAFEGLGEQDLTCKLESVQENVATVRVTGTASGIDRGAGVKLTVTASYRFDLKQSRLVSLEWKQKDDRDQGPASPATAIEVTTTLTRSVIDQPPTLTDVALVSVPDGLEVPATMLGLCYHDPKSRFDLVYGRDWVMVGHPDDQLVLRLMDRGDFVAQVTLTPWTKAEAGKHLSGEEFKAAMAETPGWEPEEELQAGEVPLEGGCWGYRLSTGGKLDGLKVTQSFYLVASPQGEQVVLAFLMTPAQVQKLGTRDLSLVGGVLFPNAAKETGTDKKP